jgi:mono/diheme cytochrome c family protein
MRTTTAGRGFNRKSWFFIIFGCAAGVSNVNALTIDSAKWSEAQERLIVKGQDVAQNRIDVADASSGLPINSVKTKANGSWVSRIDALSSVPCRIRVTSPTGDLEADVANAPADCVAPVLVMDTARWNSSANKLVVFGYADTLNTVFLTDALTGQELSTAKAGDDGRWRTEIRDLTEVPCRLQASTLGSQVDAGVRRAPGNCSSSPLSAELVAGIFAEKQCAVCHGDEGSGLTGPAITGEPASEIARALDNEEVHAGITASSEEVEALAAFLDNPSPLPIQEVAALSDPETCRTCHPRQYKEWSGNMMAYSAFSPTFSALESLGNRFSVANGRPGFAAGGHGTALFCQSCHNPVDTFLGNFPSFADSNDQPLRDFASAVGRRGISCDVCHQISMPDDEDQGLGHLGDGVANVALVLEPGDTKFGPLENPQPNPAHESAHAKDINMQDGYLGTSEFCASCHDVRTPPDSNLTVAVDPVTNEPFQRLENLFTEWQNGPYGPINNEVGGVVSCQDCHMDLGPPAPAGSYAEGETTVYPRPREVNEREKVSTHYFTGVDIALVDFPGQDDDAPDENGNLIGQVQRRQQLLESAATISVSAPAAVAAGETASIMVDVKNVGAGHNIPSGFSQERQMWVELIVSDANGTLYESGTLVDTAHPETGELLPDGNLDDEDLRNLVGPDGVSSGVIDPVTLEANVIHGPDYNERHAHPPVYKGLANFGNEFIRIPTENGTPKRDSDGHFVEDEVFMPFLSTHTDNTFSIPPLETERVRYDVTIPASAAGPISVSARLRFRALPPRFLRALAQGRPDLVNEKMIDRNRIVEMATAGQVTIQLQ